MKPPLPLVNKSNAWSLSIEERDRPFEHRLGLTGAAER
jgi:hypothetical protein